MTSTSHARSPFQEIIVISKEEFSVHFENNCLSLKLVRALFGISFPIKLCSTLSSFSLLPSIPCHLKEVTDPAASFPISFPHRQVSLLFLWLGLFSFIYLFIRLSIQRTHRTIISLVIRSHCSSINLDNHSVFSHQRSETRRFLIS